MTRMAATRDVALQVGMAAWESARAQAPTLIGREAPRDWEHGIVSKAASIFANELRPITDESIDDCRRRAISKVLGICYLGDYALESGLRFRLRPAAGAVAESAISSGVETGTTEILIGRMTEFYKREATVGGGGKTRSRAEPSRMRYVLKSADICLLQRMALGGASTNSVCDALESASAALDVVDDAIDLSEDAWCGTGNPLVFARHDPSQIRTFFEWYVEPHMERMKEALLRGCLPHRAMEYVRAVTERVADCRLSLAGSIQQLS